MIDWEIRTTKADRLIEEALDINGNIVTRNAVVSYNNRQGVVCFIWRHGTNVDALVIKTGEVESRHYCKRSCPERMDGICLGGYPVVTSSVKLVSPAGCPECQLCVSICKAKEPCSLHEEKEE